MIAAERQNIVMLLPFIGMMSVRLNSGSFSSLRSACTFPAVVFRDSVSRFSFPGFALFPESSFFLSPSPDESFRSSEASPASDSSSAEESFFESSFSSFGSYLVTQVLIGYLT